MRRLLILAILLAVCPGATADPKVEPLPPPKAVMVEPVVVYYHMTLGERIRQDRIDRLQRVQDWALSRPRVGYVSVPVTVVPVTVVPVTTVPARIIWVR